MKNKPTLQQFFLGALSIFAVGFVIGLFLLSLLVGGAKITHASTEFESSNPTGNITLQLTGLCCSGPDNYRQYSHIYYPFEAFSFNRMRFFASGDSEIPLTVFIYNDNGSTTVSAQSIGNVGNLAGLENDTFVSSFETTAYLQGDYYEAIFPTASVTGSQYIFMILTGGSGGYTSTQFETSPEYWSYKGNESGIPSPFTTYRQTVSIQLCMNECNPFGSLNEETNSNIFTIINAPLPYGTTTASTTVNLSASFQQGAGFDYSVLPATKVGFDIFDAVTNELQFSYNTYFEENTAVAFTYSTTTVLEEGSKIMKSYIRDLNGVDLALPKDTFFNVITNTYASSTGLTTPRDNPASLTQINCSTFDIGCQFQKALTFLFVPSDSVLDRYSGLWQQIRTKVPFGYVSAVIDQLQGLDDDATPAFDLGTLPFMNTLFTPLRDAFGVMLWGIYAIYFYRHRLTQLDI